MILFCLILQAIGIISLAVCAIITHRRLRKLENASHVTIEDLRRADAIQQFSLRRIEAAEKLVSKIQQSYGKD